VRRVSDNALLQEIRYDALSRRVETLDYTDPTTGVVSTTPVRTRHIYNGLKVIQEYTVTGSGGGQVSTLAREFIWGKRFPDQEVMIDYTAAGAYGTGTAEVLYYLHGALGSVVGLAEASGNLVEKYEYDPYGRTYISAPDGTARPVSAYGNQFAWTGQRYDPAVRLYHFWARSYSPALGRWLQRDPLGYGRNPQTCRPTSAKSWQARSHPKRKHKPPTTSHATAFSSPARFGACLPNEKGPLSWPCGFTVRQVAAV